MSYLNKPNDFEGSKQVNASKKESKKAGKQRQDEENQTPDLLDLESKIAVSHGPSAKAGQGEWDTESLTISEFIEELHQHYEGEKDGPCFLQGEVSNKTRTAKSMIKTQLIAFDLDTGETAEEIDERLGSLGYGYVRYSTHSHLTKTTTISRDHFFKYIGKDASGRVEVEDVRQYLTEVKGYRQRVLKKLKVTNEALFSDDGVKIVVKHNPIEKHRIVFFLDKPFFFQGPFDQGERIKEWRDRYHGLGSELGFLYDQKTTDPSRLFYFPRHKKGADYCVKFVDGKAICLDDFPRLSMHRRSTERREVSESPDRYLVNGTNLKKWAVEKARYFELVHALEQFAPEDVIREDRTRGGVTMECPFEDEHTTPGGKGFFAIDASVNDEFSEGFVAMCSHNACRHRDRLDFLKAMIENEWLPEDVLTDETWYEGLPAAEERDADWPPFPYAVHEGWLCLTKSAKAENSDERTFLRICQEFELLGRCCTDSGDGWGYIIRFRDPTGEVKELTVPSSLLFGDTRKIIAHLADNGLQLSPSADLQGNLKGLLTSLQNARVIRNLTKPGFHGDFFIVPTGQVICKTGQSINLDVRLDSRSHFHDCQTSGDLESWCDAAELASDCGNRHFVVGILSGLAGPMVQLLHLNTCGVNLSGKSSTGKSTAQMMGASVWGNPEKGESCFKPANFTANSVESMFQKGTGTTSQFDDLAHADERQIQQAIFTASAGHGKTRMNSNSEEKGSYTWSTFYTFSSEQSSRELIEKAKGVTYLTGASVRLMDVDVSSGTTLPPKLISKISRMFDHYGHAGPHFVQFLFDAGYVDDPVPLKERLEAILNEFPKTSDARFRRSAAVLALLMLTAELAVEAGLFKAVDCWADAICEVWLEFLKSKEAQALDVETRAFETLKSYLVKNKDVTIVSTTEIYTNSREKLGWYDDDYVYVVKGELVKMAGGAITERDFVRHLEKHDVLARSKDRPYVRSIKKVGQVDAYRLRKKFFYTK